MIVIHPLGPALSMFGMVFVDIGMFSSKASDLVVERNFNPNLLVQYFNP